MFNKRQIIFYGILWVLCFGVGFYIWDMNQDHRVMLPSSKIAQDAISHTGILVDIAGKIITSEDLQFEYDLMTQSLESDASLLSKSDSKESAVSDLAPLKEKILETMIERMLLYTFLGEDQSFDLENPSRYQNCLSEWMVTIKKNISILQVSDNQERLKNRLCQGSLVQQYLKEKIYPKALVSEEEIMTYFEQHKADFEKPQMVKIRQILLPSEEQAKTLKPQLSANNFSTMARRHSIAPEKFSGGALPAFAKGQMPPVFEVVFFMKTDQISEVMKSPYGFHIMILDEKIPSKEARLNEAKALIKPLLQKQKEEREYQKWIDMALHSVKITTPKITW